ncbi:MAG: hypothetical protein QOG61_475 [Candidatus Binataceae bacterium]|nr:hypothetical protein [Candidatus Binataceae bacterium]
MHTPRIVVNLVVALAIALFIGSAHAFMIGLDGSASNGSDALYALNRHGREVKIAQTGTVGPDWVVLEDLGLPTVSSDGTVLFGAAREWNHQIRWSIFEAQPDSGALLNVALPTSFDGDESLEMKADPRPQQTSDGGIVFLAHESSQGSSGDDALFKLSHGKLKRLVRTGERLSDGRTIHLIAFGSVRPESQGGIAFSGYLEPGGQAEMMVSESGTITALASQDKQLPDSEHFTSFGLPASTVTADGPLIAFTARTDRGVGLFTFAHGRLRKVLAQSATCGGGHIDYLSAARPALNDRGALAVRGKCSGTEGIFLARHGTAELIVSADQATHRGTRLDRLGDPMLSESTVFFGALTADGDSSLFNIFAGKINKIVPIDMPETNVAFPVSANRHTIETTSVSINQHGEIAYLGSP